jgi:predicted CoA-binding protein
MLEMPDSIARFLRGKRLVVAGVSRDKNQAANAVYRKLRTCGYEVCAVNPNATEVEGERCFRDIASIPGSIDGVFAATHPRVGLDLVRQCDERGIRQLWFHRSFGQGSVSKEAVLDCKTRGIECIVGGCPMMYCQPVDPFHRCIRSWLRLSGRIPG